MTGGPVVWPLVLVWLDDDDPMWMEGPWRVLRRAALASGWSVCGLFSRGNTLTATGGVGGLTDALSLRMRRRRNEVGDFDRAVALWVRTTWPTMGRAAARQADSDRTEGRRDSTGKTWLWHPPMTPPDGGVPVGKWSFDQGWTWTSGGPVRRVAAAGVREWVIR